MSTFSLHDLAAIIDARALSDGETSYTRKLLDKGTSHCAKKFGEEAVEAVIAAIGEDREHFVAECADTIFHLMVLLKSRGVAFAEVEQTLQARTSMSGLEEKASRTRS
jgi:phosphoribosyl-ATP pyrophosphohydrolase